MLPGEYYDNAFSFFKVIRQAVIRSTPMLPHCPALLSCLYLVLLFCTADSGQIYDDDDDDEYCCIFSGGST